jgi:hypothetical protein
MSYARGFSQNGTKLNCNITKVCEVELNFTVDAANGNGLGVRTIKSNGYVENVFMHTSSTPGLGNGGYTNPNPAVGFCWVQFKNNFNFALSGSQSIVSPVSGSPLTSVTSGGAYIIVSLGTTTLAQWQAAGVPQGFVPSVGMSFVAKATGAIGGTGAVEVPSVSGIVATEIVGDPNQMINNSAIAANGGAWVLLQFLGATSSGVTTLIPTAPAANSTIAMRFRFDGSSVSIPDAGPSNTGRGGL